MDELIHITGTEFKKLHDQGNVVCVLANALVKESVFTVDDLSYAKDHIRAKFIEEAIRLIKNLNEHNLWLVHTNKLKQNGITPVNE
ncbi:MAG: hypothetical protein JETCAE03_36070 [Ignavibacteriaceae bacterium]|nr:MAG: hypothetical protein JETCAE03_36070 [Ignavibacteriaceae bacterium]